MTITEVSFIQPGAPVCVDVTSDGFLKQAKLVPCDGDQSAQVRVLKDIQSGKPWSMSTPVSCRSRREDAIKGLKAFVGEWEHLAIVRDNEPGGKREEWYAITQDKTGALAFTPLADRPVASVPLSATFSWPGLTVMMSTEGNALYKGLRKAGHKPDEMFPGLA